MTEEMTEEMKKAMEKENEEKLRKEAEAEMYEYLVDQFGESAPTAEKVAEWKIKHKRVRLLPLSDEEVYFIRPVKRSEYKLLLSAAQVSGAEDQENFLRESIVQRCTLWPLMDTAQFSDAFAGTIESIYSIVMDSSNFISQEALFTVCREL